MSVDVDSDDSTEAPIEASETLVYLCALPFVLYWRFWVTMTLWSWFLVPRGVEPISIVDAGLIHVFAAWFTGPGRTFTRPSQIRVGRVKHAIVPAFVLATAKVYLWL